MVCAYGYVSLLRHEAGDKPPSIERQTELIQRWCKKKNYKLMEITIEPDLDHIGHLDVREGLQSMLRWVERDDRIVMYDVWRTTHHIGDLPRLTDAMEKRGVIIDFISEGIDTSIAAMRMTLLMMPPLAEFKLDAKRRLEAFETSPRALMLTLQYQEDLT